MYNLYFSPDSQQPLLKKGDFLINDKSGEKFPIVQGIPRFSPEVNYADNFGYQWNKFDRTQLDNFSNINISESRFYATTNWDKKDISTQSVLEVGSGAGRFSEVFLRTTNGDLHSIDYSTAVNANLKNNKKYRSRLFLSQASIYNMPYLDNTFDKVFCLGVLQHTPSFSNSVAALISKAKKGGEIIVDFYPIKGWYTKIHSKYLLRPFTKLLPKKILLTLIKINIRWMMLVFDLLVRMRMKLLTRFIPITDISNFPKGLTKKQKIEWAIMDTFDGFSPEYDNPQTIKNVIDMFKFNNCKITFAGTIKFSGGCATVVRAIKA